MSRSGITFAAKIRAALLVLVLLAGFGAPFGVGAARAQVPDPYARELAAGLARAERGLIDANFARAAGPFAGQASAGEMRRFEITLRAGVNYRVLGLCDTRCGGLDIRFYDPPESLAHANVRLQATDFGPLLDVRPAMTGVHVVEVRVQSCADAPCYFAFNLYSR